jgi:hypothetical protein
MNLKTTYILFAVLVAAMAGLALTQLFGLGRSKTKSEFIFPDLHTAKQKVEEKDIDGIRIEHAGSAQTGTYAFTRDANKNWEMQEPQRFRVDQFAVTRLVGDVLDATKEKVEVVKDLKEYELDKPHLIVTFTRGDQSWTLNVGKESQGTDPNVYVTTSSRPKEPVAVKKSRLQSVFKTLNEFRSRTLLAATEPEIDGVELQAAGKKEALILAKEKVGRWLFKQPSGYGEADYEGDATPRLATEKGGKISGVRELIRQATGLQVENQTDFVADNVGESELKDKYGLEGGNPATLRIVVSSAKKSADGESKTTATETLLIGKKVPEDKPEKKDDKSDKKDEAKKDDPKKDEKKDEKKPEFYYARLSNESSVVKVPGKSVDSLVQLASDPDALRDRDLAHFDRDKVDAIQIENAEGTVRLFKADTEPWKLWRDKTGANAEESVVRGLLDNLDPKREGKHRVDSFPTSKVKAGVDEKSRLAVVLLWAGGLKKQEKKDAEPELTDPKTPTVRLTIGKQEKDRGLVYVLREVSGEKEPTLLLVKDKEAGKEGLVDRVTPGPLAYLDRKVPVWSTAEGTHIKELTLTRNGEKIALKSEKSGEVNVWKFETPKDLQGRQADTYAVNDILFAVQRLSPLRVAAEKSSDKQLESFGLKPAQFEVAVTIAPKDGKEEKYVYSFGKETPDKSGVFAKSDRGDFVYVVPPAILTTVQAELQDKTLFTFDVDKVRGLKLTGWKSLLGTPQTLDLERISKSSWKAKSPPGFEVEASVAEAFLHTLAGLRTIKFLKGAPKPEYGLDAKSNPDLLTIEINVEGEKAPLTLTVGKPDSADKAFYAAAGNVKDQVLVLPEDAFKRVLEKPGYFAKAGQ